MVSKLEEMISESDDKNNKKLLNDLVLKKTDSTNPPDIDALTVKTSQGSLQICFI